jgi:hypothetical protein
VEILPAGGAEVAVVPELCIARALAAPELWDRGRSQVRVTRPVHLLALVGPAPGPYTDFFRLGTKIGRSMNNICHVLHTSIESCGPLDDRKWMAIFYLRVSQNTP